MEEENSEVKKVEAKEEKAKTEETQESVKPSKTESLNVHKNTFLAIILLVIISIGFGYIGGNLSSKNSLLDGSDPEVSTKIVQSQSQVITKVAEEVSPSVVSISVKSKEVVNNFYYGSQQYVAESAGTGIILTEKGMIVTNRHVIPDNTTSVTVTLSDGTEYNHVKIVGRDEFNDIAFLQIENVSGLKPAKLANSSEVKVGDVAIAIGNALGTFETTVTSGIISGLGRPIEAGTSATDSEQLFNLIQTDAAINPGNSGGPLLNIKGEVVGINTAVAGDAENIGFAIPIDDVKPGITSIEKNGELIQPYLGIRYITLDKDVAKQLKVDEETGVLVSGQAGKPGVVPNSPADDAGIKEGDVILKINDTDLSEDNPLASVVGRYQVGDKVKLKISRNGKEKDIEATLERLPKDTFQ